MRPAGMVHGRAVRPPRYGSTLESVDEGAAKSMPGVIAVVRDGSFLGVIAAREEQAIKARDALVKSAKWKPGPELPDPGKIYEYLKSRPAQTAVVNEKKGMVLAGARVHEATYTKPYMSHGSIGPSCALAEFKDGKFTVWSHGQGMFPMRNDLAKGLKVPASQVRCIHVEGSGCYGHNGADDAALDAALLARALPGRPVRVQWMRDDEFAWSPYGSRHGDACARPRSTATAGSPTGTTSCGATPTACGPNDPDGNNLLASWYLAEPQKHGTPRGVPIQFGGGADRNAVPLYDFPNQKVTNHLIAGDAAARLGAAHARGLRQRVRVGMLHGRDGGCWPKPIRWRSASRI